LTWNKQDELHPSKVLITWYNPADWICSSN
jgi:hypothetical protein